MRAINAIVGRSDHHLSGAIDSLPDIQKRLTTNNDDGYSLVPENQNRKGRKNLRRKSNNTNKLSRQTSAAYHRIDLFHVKESLKF